MPTLKIAITFAVPLQVIMLQGEHDINRKSIQAQNPALILINKPVISAPSESRLNIHDYHPIKFRHTWFWTTTLWHYQPLNWYRSRKAA